MQKNIRNLHENEFTYKSSNDYLGALSSSLCMVHCLVTPMLFAVQATSLSCSEISPYWWKMIDFIFLIVSFVAIVYTSKSTSLKFMPFLLYASWFLLAIAVINSLMHLNILPHALIYFPAIVLVILHMYNRKYCNCVKDSCCID